jgi:hypothetical protein
LTTAATWGGRAVFGRGAVAALALVLMLGACGGSGGSGSDAAAPTATVRRSPTSIAAATTTAAPGQEDFTAILRDLLARRDEAYEKNDVSILEEIYSATCPCLAYAKNVIAQRKAEGVHTAGERQKLHSVEVYGRPEPGVALVRAVTEQGPNNLVRQDGSIARSGETEPPTTFLFSLEMHDGHWRVGDIQLEPQAG